MYVFMSSYFLCKYFYTRFVFEPSVSNNIYCDYKSNNPSLDLLVFIRLLMSVNNKAAC